MNRYEKLGTLLVRLMGTGLLVLAGASWVGGAGMPTAFLWLVVGGAVLLLSRWLGTAIAKGLEDDN
jgi:hypothetical protein